MRVLHIINNLAAGGAEKLVVDSVPLYQRNNIQTDVLILQDEESFFRSSLEKQTNGKIYAVTKKSIRNPFLIFKIIPYLRRYDVIHCHLFPTLYWVIFAKMFSFNNIPVVYTEHSPTNRRRNHFILSKIDRFVYSRLRFVGCISQDVFDSLGRHLGKSDKLRVINNGVELSRFKNLMGSLKKEIFFSESDTVLIQVSSFRKQKDQKTLIEALFFLPDDVKLLLVGDGVLRSEKEEQVKKMKLEARVKFLGNRDDVPQLMSCADIAVLSSNYEGFGLAIVEGMAAGIPVVASNVPGLKEVVEGYGLLFEKGDSRALAAAVLSLYKDRNYYNSIREKCLKRAEYFDINNMIKKYAELYKQSIK